MPVLPLIPDRVECIALEDYHKTRHSIEERAANLYQRADLKTEERARRKIAAYHKERAILWGEAIKRAPAARSV